MILSNNGIDSLPFLGLQKTLKFLLKDCLYSFVVFAEETKLHSSEELHFSCCFQCVFNRTLFSGSSVSFKQYQS